MTVLIGNHCGTAAEVVAGLRLSNFPLEPLISHPVSAIENIAETTSRIRTVCGVGCLACCTNSVMPMRSKGEINLLTPQMLSSVLKVAEHLALEGVHLLSTDRLNLFSGSNELDHPFCIALRELVSAFFERTYGRRLGSISSDIVFHVSTAELFHTHLAAIVARPTLWDNICFSIDEQIPFASRVEYEEYIDRLARVWKLLIPALKSELDHAAAHRSGQPRVILNMLVPQPGSTFQEKHALLYPGGPLRATRFEQLIERYVTPFVGRLKDESTPVPDKHRFTTGIGVLASVPGSSVYVAKNYYMLAGRARVLVRAGGPAVRPTPKAIRTKLFPVSASRFKFRACFTTTEASEDEVIVPSHLAPPWFESLDQFVVDVSSISE